VATALEDLSEFAAAAVTKAAVDATKAQWNKNVQSAARRIMRLNSNQGTFARVHISMLTREIERCGGFDDQSRAAFYGRGVSDGQPRAAFYTDVAANRATKANERCHERKLDVRKPEIELEQANDIMTEVEAM
jgi:hypothetical protein